MNIKLDENLPIYLQIMNIFKHLMASGDLQAGERIAPVRELAKDFGVNPNTMQRALSELEKEGLLFSERTAGRFVTQDPSLLDALKIQEATSATDQYWQQMKSLGFTKEEALSFFTEATNRIGGHQARKRGKGKNHA